MKKECVLYDKTCDGCGECMFCELDPTKICDNCGKCIDLPDDYVIGVNFEGERQDSCEHDDCDCGHDHKYFHKH